MTFERIKQDADSIVDLGFLLNNLNAERAKTEEAKDRAKLKELDIKINDLKLKIRNFLSSISMNLKKQEAEING